MSFKRDYRGKKFGLLTVREYSHTKHSHSYWECECECGNVKIASIYKLTNGKTISCRCHMKNYNSKKSRLYGIWSQMKARCLNPKSSVYHNYGGRGITVCDRWKDFKNFQADMQESHDEHISIHGTANTTIERMDNDKGYSLDNCKWATLKEQRRNNRMTKELYYNGKRITTGEIAEKYNILYGTVESRLRLGWSVEKIIRTPVAKRTVRSKGKEC